MDINEKHESALKVLNAISDRLDEMEMEHRKDESDYIIMTGGVGDDLYMPLIFQVDDKRQLIIIDSILMFEVPDNMRVDMAIAVTRVNKILGEGSFHYNIANGKIRYRMTVPYMDVNFGKQLITYITMISFQIVDQFNDKLKLLAEGAITLEQFETIINNDRNNSN